MSNISFSKLQNISLSIPIQKHTVYSMCQFVSVSVSGLKYEKNVLNAHCFINVKRVVFVLIHYDNMVL